MLKVKILSLKNWLLIASGTFLMGLAVGLTLGGWTFAHWIFLIGFLLEIPSLIAIKRHKRSSI